MSCERCKPRLVEEKSHPRPQLLHSRVPGNPGVRVGVGGKALPWKKAGMGCREPRGNLAEASMEQ